jgi:hypothetical protein
VHLIPIKNTAELAPADPGFTWIPINGLSLAKSKLTLTPSKVEWRVINKQQKKRARLHLFSRGRILKSLNPLPTTPPDQLNSQED